MAIQGTPKTKAVIHAALDKAGMNQYNANMSMRVFDTLINNHLPDPYDCTDCKEFMLARLSYLGSYRDRLLPLGLYFGQEGGNLRTQSIGDTFSKVINYRNKSRNAAIRGKTLNNGLNVKYNPNKKANNVHYSDAIIALDKVA